MAFLLAAAAAGQATADPCPGHPDALGTSRIITVGTADFARIGSMQYKQTLPLADHEVVLTFDDGPLPPSTNRVLDTLASQCVKATFFMVGEMARAYPATARRVYNEGHTIGTHSLDHPLVFQKLAADRVEREVDGGIALVDAALGDASAVSPYFRIPGFGRSETAEGILAEHHLVTWSADVVADDWFRHITAQTIVRRAMQRLEAKGRGILLLHDIHPATADALPVLLKELKDNGFHVVQVVAPGERPKSLPDLVASDKIVWPAIAGNDRHADEHPVRRHRIRLAAAHRHRHAAVTATVDYQAAARDWMSNQY